MKKIDTFIDTKIYTNISTNTRIMSLVIGCLPVDVARHVECIGSNGQCLNLATDSAAKTSRLRFYSETILNALHNGGLTQFCTVKITTHAQQRATVKPKVTHTRARALSNDTCQIIRLTASTIENERLRNALEKLAEISCEK